MNKLQPPSHPKKKQQSRTAGFTKSAVAVAAESSKGNPKRRGSAAKSVLGVREREEMWSTCFGILFTFIHFVLSFSCTSTTITRYSSST